MKGRFLLQDSGRSVEPNVYADTSSLILEWLLLEGIQQEQFSVREVARERNVSVGLVQRVFRTLTFKGYLRVTGLRTAKKFVLKKPQQLLKSWLDEYSIVEKCKMWTYRSGLPREEILNILSTSKFKDQISLALHSAAESYQCKNTNLQTLELYLLKPTIRAQLEKALFLEPQERGYEVLLIEPYYKKMLNLPQKIRRSPLLLTFLDLYHFPLRGREQAEFMAERIASLKRIYKEK